MRIALRQKFRFAECTALFHKPMDEQPVVALKEHDVAATHFFDSGAAGQCDVARADPRLHARTTDEQVNAAIFLQLCGNLRRIAFAAFAINVTACFERPRAQFEFCLQGVHHSANSKLCWPTVCPSRDTWMVHSPT